MPDDAMRKLSDWVTGSHAPLQRNVGGRMSVCVCVCVPASLCRLRMCVCLSFPSAPQLFYKMHVIGFLVFTIFAFMHYKGLVNWVLPGLFLYGVDRAFRYWQLATNWTCITFHDFSVNGNVLTLRLTMEKVSGHTHTCMGTRAWALLHASLVPLACTGSAWRSQYVCICVCMCVYVCVCLTCAGYQHQQQAAHARSDRVPSLSLHLPLSVTPFLCR